MRRGTVAGTDNPGVRLKRRRRVRRAAITFGLLALAGVPSAEGFLRWRYGLGNPPQMMSDELTEYRYVPDREYRRRGNRIAINTFSMRSDPFPAKRSRPDELRVIVIGDSVVNGGAQTDQSRLATSLLQDRLRADSPGAIVGNASAGSWGPQNMLGYVRRFGLLDANVVAIVVSSHDAADSVVEFPSRTELAPPPYRFALTELYGQLSDRWGLTTAGGAASATQPYTVGDPGPCLMAFGEMLDAVRAAGATPVVVFHYEAGELDPNVEVEGHRLLREVCESRGVTPIVRMREQLGDSRRAGRDPFRDAIHPNDVGQMILADVLTTAVRDALTAHPSSR